MSSWKDEDVATLPFIKEYLKEFREGIENNPDCKLDEEEVFRMNLFPAIAANPFLVFSATAEQSGTLTITFTDDNGVEQTETTPVEVV